MDEYKFFESLTRLDVFERRSVYIRIRLLGVVTSFSFLSLVRENFVHVLEQLAVGGHALQLDDLLILLPEDFLHFHHFADELNLLPDCVSS